MRRALLLLALVTGCLNNDPPKPPDEHPPIAQPEIDRGLEICQHYLARVCACAEKDSTLKETCALAKAEPSAVQMHLDVLHGAPLADLGADGKVRDAGAVPARRPPLNDNERRLTESSLRKIVAGCVNLDAQLPASCPRI